MYYEIKHNQVDWDRMGRRRLTIGGDYCWRAEGVTIYQPTGDKASRPVVPHRFAINLGHQNKLSRQNLRKDRYYIHVYQTKIGSERRTLRSKEIAHEIGRRWRKEYLPRPIDNSRVKQETHFVTRDRERNSWKRSDTNYTGSKRTPQRLTRTERETNSTNNQQLTENVQRLTEVLEKLLTRNRCF